MSAYLLPVPGAPTLEDFMRCLRITLEPTDPYYWFWVPCEPTQDFGITEQI